MILCDKTFQTYEFFYSCIFSFNIFWPQETEITESKTDKWDYCIASAAEKLNCLVNFD
jgi:hypothetical protein